MITDLQPASFMKRFSAFLLDIIMIVIVSTGGALLLSTIVNFDKHVDKVTERIHYYEETYDLKVLRTQEEVDALSEEEKAKYEEVNNIMLNDKEYINDIHMVYSLVYVIIVFGVLLGVIIPEFIIPLFFKNGQTLGKKAFGLVVIKNNGVKASQIQLLIRSLLGKYTIEIMIPVLSLVTLFLMGRFVILWLLLAVLLIITNICLVIFTRNHTMIHDIFSFTVVCNKETQMIFNSESELLQYKKDKHLDEVTHDYEYKVSDDKKSEV